MSDNSYIEALEKQNEDLRESLQKVQEDKDYFKNLVEEYESDLTTTIGMAFTKDKTNTSKHYFIQYIVDDTMKEMPELITIDDFRETLFQSVSKVVETMKKNCVIHYEEKENNG